MNKTITIRVILIGLLIIAVCIDVFFNLFTFETWSYNYRTTMIKDGQTTVTPSTTTTITETSTTTNIINPKLLNQKLDELKQRENELTQNLKEVKQLQLKLNQQKQQQSQQKSQEKNDTNGSVEVKGDDPCNGKEEIISILQKANVTMDIGTPVKKASFCQQLPTWKSVVKLYGSKPIIHGLDTCKTYQNIIKSQYHDQQQQQDANETNYYKPMPRIGGLYNTGTNALAWTFIKNLKSMKKDSIGALHPYEVPWGKHVSSIHRLTNTFPRDNTEPPNFVLPIILIRDPYIWMQRLCKSPYDLQWKKSDHCPNLVLSEREMIRKQIRPYRHISTSTTKGGNMTATVNQTLIPVNVVMRLDQIYRKVEKYKSLPDYWSTYYKEYYDATYPRLIIRYEDFLFHTEYIYEAIMQCAGFINGTTTTTTTTTTSSNSTMATHTKKFRYMTEPGKKHRKTASTYLSSLISAGSESSRSKGYTTSDLEYADLSLDRELMESFHYIRPPPPLPIIKNTARTTARTTRTSTHSTRTIGPSTNVNIDNIDRSIGTCGHGVQGNGICKESDACCSRFGWCGTTASHCR